MSYKMAELDSSRNELGPGQRITLLEKFLKYCGGRRDCQLTKEMLSEFAGVQTKFYTDRLFILIKNETSNRNGNNDTITFSEFCSFVKRYSTGNEDSKTELLFQIYDLNGDGVLDKKELVEMLRVSMKENKLTLDDTMLDTLGTTLLEEGLGEYAELSNNPALKLQDFRNLFKGHKHLIQNLSTIIEKWLQPIPEEKKKRGARSEKCYNLLHWFQNNATFTFWVAAFFLTNAALFAIRIVIFYSEGNPDNSPVSPSLAIARGFGWCLNFSSSFILLTMMRKLLTRLRATPLFNIFPIDDHKRFHRIVGKFIVAASLGHGVAHLINVKFTVDNQQKWDYFSYLFTLEATKSLGLIPGFAYISGFILVAILLSMFFFIFSFVRRNGYFHAFYISHMICYPLFYIILVLHCKNFWKWFIFPGIIFAIEQIVRTYYNYFGFRTTVKMGVILPSKVTNLVLKRPPGFNFVPGDYLFINLPHLSKFEWHAFTISSAPENWDELSLHIRAVGPWTENLYEFYSFLKKCSDIQVQFPNGAPATHDPSRITTRSSRMVGNFIRRNGITNLTTRSRLVQSVVIDANRSAENPMRMTHTGGSGNSSSRQFTVTTGGIYRNLVRKPDSIVISNDEESPPVFDTRNRRGTTVQQQRNHIYDTPTNIGEHEALVAATDEPQLPKKYTRIFGDPLIAYIDGPYGAPSSEIFRAEHAVLIGAGIGVTPFASILQSIMYRHWDAKITCPSCQFKFSHGFHSQVNRLRKVDFFWTNPEQNAFSWFVNLLSKLEIEQDDMSGQMDRFLDIHMYMTKALQGNDMKAVALQLVLDLFYERNKRDCLTKLKARMNAGRPNWDKVFAKIKASKKGAVSVFFCGPKQMGAQIEQFCARYEFTFRTESF